MYANDLLIQQKINELKELIECEINAYKNYYTINYTIMENKDENKNENENKNEYANDLLMQQKIDELKELIKCKRNACKHTFIFSHNLYYDPSDYDGEGGGYICTKCRFTSKNGQDFAKLPIYRFTENNKLKIYLDDFIIDNI